MVDSRFCWQNQKGNLNQLEELADIYPSRLTINERFDGSMPPIHKVSACPKEEDPKDPSRYQAQNEDRR